MTPITRIEQIHYELQAIARIQDHRERERLLKEYEPELSDFGGGRKSTIGGLLGVPLGDLLNSYPGFENMTLQDVISAATPGLSAAERADYILVLNKWKRMLKESERKVARLDKFEGSAKAFSDWFKAVNDSQVEAIFGKTYTPPAPIEWIKSTADACRFALAVWGPDSNARLNKVFKSKNGTKFVIKQQLKFRVNYPERKNPVPEILKIISKYQRINNEDFLRAYPPLRLFQSTGHWDTNTDKETPWVTKEEYDREDSIRLPSYCR